MSHPWNFAIKRKALTETGSTPVFGFSNEFSLPFDYLRGLDFEATNREWQVEGNKILTNDTEIKLRYIADVDEDLFTEYFSEVFSYELAYDLCYSLVQSASYRDQLLKDKELFIASARSFDAQEGTPPELTDNSWTNVRL